MTLKNTNGHPECVVERSHPDCVTLDKVVVGGDNVDAFACNCIEVGRECGCKGFTFARTQLGDTTIVLHHATDELDIEVAHLELAPGCLATGGKGFREDVIEGLVVGLGHVLAGFVLGFIPNCLADTGAEFFRLTF